jgi:hypothetical protein
VALFAGSIWAEFRKNLANSGMQELKGVNSGIATRLLLAVNICLEQAGCTTQIPKWAVLVVYANKVPAYCWHVPNITN